MTDQTMYQEEIDHELAAILEEYRKRRLFETLLGPVVSLVFHIALLGTLVIVLDGEVKAPVESTVVEMKKEDIKELEEIEEIEEIVEEQELTDEVVEEVETDMVAEETPDEINETMPDMEADVETEIAEIKARDSGLTLPKLFGARMNQTGSVAKYGGRHGAATQKAVRRVLRWLKKTQHKDGYWPAKGDPLSPTQRVPAMTALATLTYLANGKTPTDEKYGDTIEASIAFLVDAVDMESGFTKVGIKAGSVYENALVCYALAEAYGMTKISSLKPVVTKMIGSIVDNQRKGGSWSYHYNPSKHSDTSVAGWHLQALKAAIASGIVVDGMKECIQKGNTLLIEGILTEGDKAGIAYYQPEEKAAARVSMGAVSALCLQLLGEGRHNKVKVAYNRIKSDFSDPAKSKKLYGYYEKGKTFAPWGHPSYNWYYQSQVVFNRLEMTFWRKWNTKILYELLTKNQTVEKITNDEGKEVEIGYWPSGISGAYGDYYTTCLNALTLQVYYRNLPTMGKKLEIKGEKDTGLFAEDDSEDEDDLL